MSKHTNHQPRKPGQIAGLAPSAADVSRARRGQWLALAIYGIPLILLMVGLYFRLFASAERLALPGFFGAVFGYLFPLIAVSVLAALLWALVVEPYSRGNTLGDHLRSQEQVDAETVQIDEELLANGWDSASEAKLHAEAVRTALISADEEIADMAEVGHRGLQIAHAALGVGTIGGVRAENMIPQTFPQRQRIERAVEAEVARTRVLAEALESHDLPKPEQLDSPHLVYTMPPSVVPDLAFVVPATLAPHADSTLGWEGDQDPRPDERPSHGRRAIVGAMVAAVLIAGVAAYFLADHSSAGASVKTTAADEASNDSAAIATDSAPVSQTASATTPTVAADPNSPVPANPAVPAGLVEGVDFSFGSHTTVGSIVRWDCTTPITVRLAGTAPAGSKQAVADAVDQLKNKSNLPLQMGASLPDSVLDSKQVPTNEIIYNYLTEQQIADAGMDLVDDRLGLGGVTYDDSGRALSGWVGIRAEEPATDPTTTTGREVAWHEGAHALNVGHAAMKTSSPEIMAPVTDPTEELGWGPGDSYALASVGCAQP